MEELTKLQEALNGCTCISAMNGKIMHIYKEGKVKYVNLFVSSDDGKVYASSIREDDSLFLGKLVITNTIILAGGNPSPLDKINITQALPQYAVGEIAPH